VRHQISYSIVADGGTDRALRPVIDWAIRELDPTVEILEPDFTKRTGGVGAFFRDFVTGNQLIFAHRDCEADSLATRMAEFDSVERDDVVPVIPMRMTETWLVFDAAAIALAAGKPDASVSVPRIAALEGLADPKSELEDLLIEASGLSGRRLKTFRSGLVERRVDVANRIDDFSPLRATSAFAAFEDALSSAYPYRIE
jgi:hypothetical protein